MFFSSIGAPGRKHVNLLSNTNDPTEPAWSLTNATSFQGTEAGPREDLFFRVRFINTNAFFFQPITLTNGDTYTGGLWIKADAVGTIRFVVAGVSTASKGVTINLTTDYQFVELTDTAEATNRFGLDNRGASGADGLAKNVAFGYCQLNPGSTLEPYREIA